MQYIENYEYNSEPADDVDDDAVPADRVRRMVIAFRRAPAVTVQEWKEVRRRCRAWREERLTPFVSALAKMIVADLTRG